MKRRPGNSRVLQVLTSLVAVALSFATGWGDPRWWALPLSAVGFALGSWLAGSQTVSRTRWATAAVDGVAGICLALDPGAWVVLCALLGVTIAQALRDIPVRRAADTIVRTLAAAAAGAAVSVTIVRFDDTPSAAAAAGMLAWWLTSHTLSVLAVARTTGRSPRRLFSGRVGATLPGAGLGAALGVTSAWLAVHAPAGLLGLSAPVLIVVMSHLNGARTMAETQILRELLGAQSGRRADTDRQGRRSMDDSVQLAMTSAARLLGGADVEVLALGTDGALRFAGHERGDAARTRVQSSAYDDPWVRRCLQPTAPGDRARARRGLDAGRPVLAVRLGPGGSAGAVLLARRPVGAARFTRADAAVAEALAAHTAGWLPTAIVGSGPTEDDGSPHAVAVAAVRSSSARMARLTDLRTATGATRRVDLDAVVDELRELERAVAVLLGDRAAAADRAPAGPAAVGPAVAGPAVAGPAVSDADAWTTSGLMARPAPW